MSGFWKSGWKKTIDNRDKLGKFQREWHTLSKASENLNKSIYDTPCPQIGAKLLVLFLEIQQSGRQILEKNICCRREVIWYKFIM